MTSTATDLDTREQLLTKFRFTPEQVARVARERVAAARDRRAR